MGNLGADFYGNRLLSSKVSSDTLLQGTAKAWANLNGTGTIALRDSFNISSVVDNGVGNYTENFSVAQPNTNYIAMVTVNRVTNVLVVSDIMISTTVALFTSTVLSTPNGGSVSVANADTDRFYTAFYGDPTP